MGMGITYSPEVAANIKKMLKKMGDTKEAVEIPGFKGCFLVRIGSKAYEERFKDLSILFFEYNDKFCVTTK